MNSILIIGSLDDSTCRYVVDQANIRGVSYDYLDVARTILSGTWSTKIDGAEIEVGGIRYQLRAYSGIFYRFVPLRTAELEPDLLGRTDAFFDFLHDELEHLPIPVSTKVGRGFHNFSKVLHSHLLMRALNGTPVRTPESIVSNCAENLRDFAARHKFAVIAKGVSGSKTWAMGLDEESFERRLKYLADTPVHLQRWIQGWECRAHVVGGNVFAESIHSCHADYRRKKGTKFSQVILPRQISTACTRVVDKIGYGFAGLDFKVEGDVWYILEANSMPCYQGYDRRANGQISDALLKWLSDG